MSVGTLSIKEKNGSDEIVMYLLHQVSVDDFKCLYEDKTLRHKLDYNHYNDKNTSTRQIIKNIKLSTIFNELRLIIELKR